MEFKEISQEKIRATLSNAFCMFGSSDGSRFGVISENGAFTLETDYTPESTAGFTFQISTIDCPQSHPINCTSYADTSKIFANADTLEKQIMSIDPIYASEFSPAAREFQIVQACLTNSSKTDLVAIISNFAACEIRTRSISKSWNQTVVDLSRIWCDECEKTKTKFINFEELNRFVEEMQITACCWSDMIENTPKEWNLFVVTATSKLVSFKGQLEDTKIDFTASLHMGKINYLKSFSQFKDNTTFILASDVPGMIKLFKIVEKDCKEITVLWKQKDKMRCRHFEIYFCNEREKFVILATKGAHLLIFLLSKEGELLATKTHYCGNIEISGLQTLSLLQYIIASINGHVTHLTVILESNEIKLQIEEIKHSLNTKTYQILGMMTTTNRAGWVFLLYPHLFTDAVYCKNPTILSITALNSRDPLDILLKNPTNRLKSFEDCAETIRCGLIKNIYNKRYSQFAFNTIQLNENFLYKLKIYNIITLGLMVGNRRSKSFQKAQQEEEKSSQIESTILAIRNYQNLERLNKVGQLSDFQKLACLQIRGALKDFIKKELVEPLANIKNILLPIFEISLLESEDDESSEFTKCSYCGEDVEPAATLCKNNHPTLRCCITNLCTPILTQHYCAKCNFVALPDENQLREILGPNASILCPLCDRPLILVT